MKIEFYDFESLTSGTAPRLEDSSKAFGEIDNNWFSIGIPREEHGALLSPMDANTFWSHDFPPVFDHLLFNQKRTNFCCQVNSELVLGNYIHDYESFEIQHPDISTTKQQQLTPRLFISTLIIIIIVIIVIINIINTISCVVHSRFRRHKSFPCKSCGAYALSGSYRGSYHRTRGT